MTTQAVSTFTWILFGIPLLIMWGIGIYDIFRRPLSSGLKAAWLLIVLLLPVVGTITYFVLRKPSPEEVRLSRQARAEGVGGWQNRLRRGGRVG